MTWPQLIRRWLAGRGFSSSGTETFGGNDPTLRHPGLEDVVVGTGLSFEPMKRAPPHFGGDRSLGAGHSFSKPWLVKRRVFAFSVTVRTTWSGAPDGICAWTSSVTVT